MVGQYHPNLRFLQKGVDRTSKKIADVQLFDPTESPVRKHLRTRLTHTLASRDRNEVKGLEVTDEINPTLT